MINMAALLFTSCCCVWFVTGGFMRNTLKMLAGSVALMAVAPAAMAAPSIWESDFGSVIVTGDDLSTTGNLGFAFPFLGSSYSSFEASTNGFLSFGGLNGSDCCNGNVTEFLSESARIAANWFDVVGPVYLNTAVAGRAVFTWDGYEFSTPSKTLTFQAQLFENGNITFGYTGQNFDADHDILIGVTGGNGAADPGSTNFAGLANYSTGSVGTIYQFIQRPGGGGGGGGGGEGCETDCPDVASALNIGVPGLQDANIFLRPNGQGGWFVNAASVGAVPEPAAWAMMIAGFGLVGGAMRRRTKVSVSYA
jgi:hypothetical protein